MDMIIKIILFMCFSFSMLISIDMKEIVGSVDKDFKTSVKNKVIKKKTKMILEKKDNILDILSKELWSNLDKDTSTKIYSQNLKDIIKTKKISNIAVTKNYTGVMDYVDNVIDKELTSYISWVVIIQSFIIILFIILYIDLNYKIKNISLGKTAKAKPENDKVVSSNAIDARHKENLRKIFL